MSEPHPNPILVTFALAEEARPFRAAAGDLAEVQILVTGIGRSNTERTIRQALADAKPRLVLTCGYAGALDPALKIGDVVFEAAPSSGLADKFAGLAQPVKFFCSDKVLVTVAQKAQARAESAAQAVDMESEFIRRACRVAGIPSATVRAISDLADEDFPLDFNRLSKPDQSLDPKKLAWAIVTSPRSIPGLLRLRRNTRLAADALADTLHRVITRLKSETRNSKFE